MAIWKSLAPLFIAVLTGILSPLALSSEIQSTNGTMQTASTKDNHQVAEMREEHKLQTELRVSLNLEGFEALKARLPKPEHASREDFYYDQFMSGGFVLKYKPQAVKVRLMTSPEKVDAQVSRKISQVQQVFGGLPVTLTKGEAWQRLLLESEYSSLLESSRSFLSALAKGGDVLAVLAKRASHNWTAVPWPGMELLETSCSGEKWDIYPAAASKKLRLKSNVTYGQVEFRIQLGDAQGWDEQGNPTHSYEVEAEPRNADKFTADHLMNSFARVLQIYGLDAQGVGPVSPDAFAFTADQLTKSLQR